MKSLRPFVGCADFAVSKSFYSALGFEEFVIAPNMSLFRIPGGLAFYLQDAYVKDWVDNTMLFLEVDDLDQHHADTLGLNLPSQFKGVRVSGIRTEEWGREYFIHDPSGVLWHVGTFV